MKDIYKYIAIGLALLLAGMLVASMHTQSKLKDRIIELQEQTPVVVEKTVHDTVTFEKPVIKWKTRHDSVEFVTRDTFYHNDTITIVQSEKVCLDSFSVVERYLDSNIDATIHVQGRGIYENTFVDSISLEYQYIKEELIPQKKCCWLRRIFGACKINE